MSDSQTVFTHVVVDCPADLASEGYPPSVYWAHSAEEAEGIVRRLAEDGGRHRRQELHVFEAGKDSGG